MEFLDRTETDQLKGIAILFVVLGHLWVHVSDNRPTIILGDDAVALFLLLSGFGLVKSYLHKPLGAREFFFRRTKRVMFPYWVATVILISLDYFVLDRSYSFSNLALTLMGLNLDYVTRHIDYVRWYITFLIFWYFVFSFMITRVKIERGIFFLLLIAVIVLPLDYYVFHFGWYQIFAFPVGCILGFYHDSIHSVFLRYANKFLIFSLIIIMIKIAYEIFIFKIIIGIFPFILCKFSSEIMSLLFSFSLLFVIAYIGSSQYYSRFLVFMGAISYELFLLHGAFLVKYNPVISSGAPVLLIAQFVIYFMGVILLSIIFQRSLRKIV